MEKSDFHFLRCTLFCKMIITHTVELRSSPGTRHIPRRSEACFVLCCFDTSWCAFAYLFRVLCGTSLSVKVLLCSFWKHCSTGFVNMINCMEKQHKYLPIGIMCVYVYGYYYLYVMKRGRIYYILSLCLRSAFPMISYSHARNCEMLNPPIQTQRHKYIF